MGGEDEGCLINKDVGDEHDYVIWVKPFNLTAKLVCMCVRRCCWRWHCYSM